MTPKFAALIVALVTAGCCGSVDDARNVELDASVPVDASVAVDASDPVQDAGTPVPEALAPFDCVPSPREEMGASPDTSATFQIWLDGSALYTCHGNQHPQCPGFGGTPTVFDCRTQDLTGAQ